MCHCRGRGLSYLYTGLQTCLFHFNCKSKSLEFIPADGRAFYRCKMHHTYGVALTYISDPWQIFNFPYQGCNITEGPQQVSQEWHFLPTTEIVLCNLNAFPSVPWRRASKIFHCVSLWLIAFLFIFHFIMKEGVLGLPVSFVYSLT